MQIIMSELEIGIARESTDSALISIQSRASGFDQARGGA
jgi:hypothetical protein